MRAHPRVGGENDAGANLPLCCHGSSPRGRGKRARALQAVLPTGLIPAWAGKTGCLAGGMASWAAHPRVGGENHWSPSRKITAAGSSPRGRGKQAEAAPVHGRGGLIPAWAGKTSSGPGRAQPGPAHPRVGGENYFNSFSLPVIHGSSPRGRGKLVADAFGRGFGGLIPAWAGKTPAKSARSSA